MFLHCFQDSQHCSWPPYLAGNDLIDKSLLISGQDLRIHVLELLSGK